MGKRSKLGLQAHSSSGLGSQELISAAPAIEEEKPCKPHSPHKRRGASGLAYDECALRASSLPYDYLPHPAEVEPDARPGSRLVSILELLRVTSWLAP